MNYAKEIISCPGESVSIFTIKDRIASFQRPLDFWEWCIEKKAIRMLSKSNLLFDRSTT
jgi:hypothetical protein